MEDEWQERRNMVNFLYEKGWMLSKLELEDVICTYDLKREWEDYKENLSNSSSDLSESFNRDYEKFER